MNEQTHCCWYSWRGWADLCQSNFYKNPTHFQILSYLESLNRSVDDGNNIFRCWWKAQEGRPVDCNLMSRTSAQLPFWNCIWTITGHLQSVVQRGGSARGLYLSWLVCTMLNFSNGFHHLAGALHNTAVALRCHSKLFISCLASDLNLLINLPCINFYRPLGHQAISYVRPCECV